MAEPNDSVTGLLFIAREAVASISLSHPQACVCDVCKAARGDATAFAKVLAEMNDA